MSRAPACASAPLVALSAAATTRVDGLPGLLARLLVVVAAARLLARRVGRRQPEALGQEIAGAGGVEALGSHVGGGIDLRSIVLVRLDAGVQPSVGRQLEAQPRHALAVQQQTTVGAIAPVLVAPGGLAGGGDGQAHGREHGVDLVDAGGERRLQVGPLLLERQVHTGTRGLGASGCGSGQTRLVDLRAGRRHACRGKRWRLRRGRLGVVGDRDLGLGLGIGPSPNVALGDEGTPPLGVRVAPDDADAGADQGAADDQNDGRRHRLRPPPSDGRRPVAPQNALAARKRPRRREDVDAICPATPP